MKGFIESQNKKKMMNALDDEIKKMKLYPLPLVDKMVRKRIEKESVI